MEDTKKIATISTGSQALTVIAHPRFVYVGAILTEGNEVVAMLPLQSDQNLQLIQALETAQKELDPGYKTREELQAEKQNDEEYKKLREYAISLEQRIGIYQEIHGGK